MEYYHIDMDFRPSPEVCAKNGAWLYIVNYYGQLTDEMIGHYKETQGNVIVDNVQGFFQKPMQGVDTLYTCRKFFGVPDGAYLYTDARLTRTIPQDVSYDRMQYILGRFEVGANAFYQASVQSNALFEDEPIKEMSKLTHNLLRAPDYAAVKRRRTENFAFLHDALQAVNQLSLSVPEGAFMYPLYVKNGKKLRAECIANQIYTPTLWPGIVEICEQGSRAYEMAENIVPLPIDQRYTKEDMRQVLAVVNKLVRE